MWAIFGFVVGLIAHAIDPGDVKGGFLGTTFLGIAGALVGGFVASSLLGLTEFGFTLQSFAAAVGGALLLAFVYRSLFRNHSHIKTMTKQLR